MVIHNTLTGSELHDPLGAYDSDAGAANPLVLANQASAYVIQFDTTNVAFQINCVSNAIHLGNDTDASTDIELHFGTTGELRLDGAAGTAGYVLTSNGTDVPPTWQASASGFDPTDINITDNLAEAFNVEEGTNHYINIATTDASEAMTFGNATTNPTYTFAGTGTTTLNGDLSMAESPTATISAANILEISPANDLRLISGDNLVCQVQDNKAAAFRITENIGSGDIIMDVDSRTGSETVYFGNSAATVYDFTFRGAGDFRLPSGLLYDGAASSGASTNVLTRSASSTAWAALDSTYISDFSTAADARIAAAVLDDLADVTETAIDTGDILYWNGFAWVNLGAGASSTVLTSNGVSAAPSWQAAGGFDPTDINITDNLAEAFNVEEGTNHYINIATTDAAEAMTFGNATTNPTYSFAGSGATTLSSGNLTFPGTRFVIAGGAGFKIGDTGGSIGTNSVTVGNGAAQATGTSAWAGGHGAVAAGSFSAATGGSAYAVSNSVSYGYSARSDGTASFAILQSDVQTSSNTFLGGYLADGGTGYSNCFGWSRNLTLWQDGLVVFGGDSTYYFTTLNVGAGNTSTGTVRTFTIRTTDGGAATAGWNLALRAGDGGSGGAGGNTTVRAGDATGTNIAAGDLTISTGRATGTGDPGQIILQTTDTLGSGSTAQTLYDRLTIDGDGLFLKNGNTNPEGTMRSTTGYTEVAGNSSDVILSLPLPTGANYAGALLEINVVCSTDIDEYYYYGKHLVRCRYDTGGGNWTFPEINVDSSGAGANNDWDLTYAESGGSVRVTVVNDTGAGFSAGNAHWSANAWIQNVEAV